MFTLSASVDAFKTWAFHCNRLLKQVAAGKSTLTAAADVLQEPGGLLGHPVEAIEHVLIVCELMCVCSSFRALDLLNNRTTGKT